MISPARSRQPPGIVQTAATQPLSKQPLTVIAIYLLFRAFDRAFELANLDHRHHPPHALRMFGCTNIYEQILPSHLTLDQKHSLSISIILEAEKCFCLVTGKDWDLDPIANALGPQSFEYAGIISANWGNLRSQLVPRAGDLPPAQEAWTV